MNEPRNDGAGWLLVAIALFADVVGILGFLGFDANHNVRVAVTAALGMIGIVVAATYLISAMKLWLSPQGAYYPSLARILVAAVALAIAVALSAAAIHLATNANETAKSTARAAMPL